jgi:proteic killer suppression protein
MNIAGFYFHALTGDKKGLYTAQISGNWCITFEFKNGDAYIVNFED